MSPQKDQEYFADGIAEEILNALGHVQRLHVIGRTSSFSFKGKTDDLRTIGQKLNVGTILQGSVRKEGTRVRIVAQIVNVSNGYPLWSRTFDRDVSGVFAIQDEIGRAVVEALTVELLHGRFPPPRRETSSEAFRQFLIGRHSLNRASAEGFEMARVAFERAVDLDPGYAAAWAGLADALEDLGDLSEAPAERRLFDDRALAATDRAIALGPECPTATPCAATCGRALWNGPKPSRISTAPLLSMETTHSPASFEANFSAPWGVSRKASRNCNALSLSIHFRRRRGGGLAGFTPRCGSSSLLARR